MLGVELDRRQRILDLVGHLARHLGPRIQTVGVFEFGPLPREIACHAIEIIDQPAELVR